jgi:hypothetical protein
VICEDDSSEENKKTKKQFQIEADLKVDEETQAQLQAESLKLVK